MSHFLVTGGSGFFGGILKRRLLREGHTCVNLDLERDEDKLLGLTSIQGDLRDAGLLRRVFDQNAFDGVFHCAAQLAHGFHVDEELLWTSNVDATRLLAETAREHRVKPFVFISSNCLWAQNMGRPVTEDDPPCPIEIYGKSKLQAEKELAAFEGDLNVVTLRCPTIMDSGRLGLLAILYEFMDDGNTVWVVGDGENKYQFIYAEDLATACIKGIRYNGSGLFHIGSDNVKSMREVYNAVIRSAGSRSRVASLPKKPVIAAMKMAHKLRMSPLGPYHYKMIAESFCFDTHRIKEALGWEPTLTNEEMLLRAYSFYSENRRAIAERKDVSAHRKAAPMGIIRVLKWVS